MAIILLLFLFQGSAFAQTAIPLGATLSGNEAVPTNSFGISVCGRFWLQGTNLVYRFATIGFGVSANPLELHGPAGPGTNGPLLRILNFSSWESSLDLCGTAEGLPPPEPPPRPGPGFPPRIF